MLSLLIGKGALAGFLRRADPLVGFDHLDLDALQPALRLGDHADRVAVQCGINVPGNQILLHGDRVRIKLQIFAKDITQVVDPEVALD